MGERKTSDRPSFEIRGKLALARIVDLICNLDYNPIELAHAYHAQMERNAWTMAELARQVRAEEVSRGLDITKRGTASHIRKTVPLRKLAKIVQDQIIRRELTQSHGYVISRYPEPMPIDWALKVVAEDITRDDLAALLARESSIPLQPLALDSGREYALEDGIPHHRCLNPPFQPPLPPPPRRMPVKMERGLTFDLTLRED